jgi:hypothetical protein
MQCGHFFRREERLASLKICSWSLILMMWVIFIRLLSHGVTMIWFFFPAVLNDRVWQRCTSSIRSFRDIDRDGLHGAAASLDSSALWFLAGVNEKVECFYTMLNFLLGTFVPVRRILGHRRRQIMQRSQLVWRECGAYGQRERCCL